MKIKPAVIAAAAATALGVFGAPIASADAEVQYLGQPGELVNGSVVQHWTITGLKPSSDAIPYQPAGTLWEATATDEAIAGSVTPVVSNLNARARNGETYRVLFTVATPQGVNPSTLAQGEKTSGKIYFDVTGEKPDSVFYSDGGPDQLLLWVEPPPPPAPSTGGYRGPASSGSSSSGSASSGAAENEAPETAPTSTTPTPGAAPASATETPTPVPAGSAGTPLPQGSSGTPLPAGSAGTPVPADAAPASPAPVPAAVSPAPAPAPAAVSPAPQGSSGTPLPAGSSGTPAAVQSPATTTVVVPPPA
ncbi:MAG: MPT63 family protein [Mycobacterium kyogaense]|uniref:MPT63 family protein n=1 Tax=Mycobacterium kyogaense TaxID=2212479 RepID=UPI002FFB447F